MKIIEKIIRKQNDIYSDSAVRIAFLGDSVTQGCFEIYEKLDGGIETIFDPRHTYHEYLRQIFATLYPKVPINIINAGLSGDTAPGGLKRIDCDVLSSNPDLVVVCFGLNDSTRGKDAVGEYTDALGKIFTAVRDAGCELIFMTPNMSGTEASPFTPDELKATCEGAIKANREGVMDFYIDASRKLCRDMDVTVCDCYAKWKKMHECGVNVTELLANKCNHPTREMNKLFAYSLTETILGM